MFGSYDEYTKAKADRDTHVYPLRPDATIAQKEAFMAEWLKKNRKR